MIKKILLILLVAVTLYGTSNAQDKKDQRTVTTRIADLMAQLPSQNAKQFKSNMDEISQLGTEGYTSLISGLTAPGKGNNALIEYAVSGFSGYVSQPGMNNWKMMAEEAYLQALDKLSDPQNKAFVISQLELTGTDRSVPVLGRFLTEQALADVASRSLVKINTQAAKAALLNALSGSTGSARLSVIAALGDIHHQAAVQPITALASGNDASLTKMALYALAEIADPSSEPVFSAAVEKNNYAYDKTNALEYSSRYAENLLKKGNTSIASKIALQLSQKATADNQVHIRIGALAAQVKADPSKKTALLLEAVKDKNIIYRGAALKLVDANADPADIALWIAGLKKAEPRKTAEIVTMLGNSRSQAALPAISKLLKSKDEGVRLAAIDAAAKIGQEQSLDALLKVMAKGSAADQAAVTKAISRMKGDGITAKVAAFIPKAKPEVQVALLDVLASRAANAQLNTVYSQLKNKSPEVRKAAYAALKQTVTSENLPQLFTLMNENADPSELADIQAAVIAGMRGTQNIDQQAEQVLQQMAAAPDQKKTLYYKILGSLGGSKSLSAVTEAFNSGDAEKKKAAIEALSSWADAASAPELIRIARNPANAANLNQALEGYLGLVRKNKYQAEQRLLLLREAMDIANTTGQRQQILKDAEQAKCLNTLLFVGKYLDQQELQSATANTIMNVVLADKSYHGVLVRDLLNKTIASIKGADSEYQKEALRKYLAEMPAGEGFVPIYNGKDLTGWKGLVADPIKRSKMDAATLASAQEKADAAAIESWKVLKNGDLHFASKGNNLATVKKYGDFEMLVDWKIIDDKKGEGDAGIYLRGTPQVQIWDNARVKVGAQVGSGGLYNNKVHESKPLKVADNKLDEWNTFRILMIGDRVTVYLNGQLVTDNVILENYWDRNLPIFAEEQIELQAHGSPVSYRDIYIREIPRVKPFELSAQEKKEGYKVLFDGTNMHQWTGNTTDYIIENGNLAVRPKKARGTGLNLYTKEEFSDFIFRFEFQLTPGANNGLGIRAPLEGDAAYTGMELQILDNDAPIYSKLHVYQYHGSIYGTLPAKRGYLKPTGEWNYQEVVVKGPKIKVILNGTVILDADITEARKNGTPDGKQHPGLLRDSGHIGFLGHGSPVQFRNIRIKDISTPKKAVK
jgi:HEAT repeat protein